MMAFVAAGLIAAGVMVGAQSERLHAELRRIFESRDYAGRTFGPATWLDGGSSYVVVETTDKTSSLVGYETATGRREVLVDSSALTPPGAAALPIDGYEFSRDRRSVLIFTNTKKVWRQNTRGDYWIFNRDTRTLRKIGKDAPESSLMFAKLSPDGLSVAYVRDRNLYVEKVASGEAVRLTADDAETIINGTSDWVNEEELGIRDGFRWSPDSRSIAFWQFDTSGVERFSLVNDTAGTYPTVVQFPYPKAGTVNSAVRIGVIGATGGAVTWMNAPGDPRNTYLARLQWTNDGGRLLMQQLNRQQNTNDLLSADARTGDVRQVFRDTNQAWVDVVDDVIEIGKGAATTWLSEKDGWRHLYAVPLDGSAERLVTKFAGDVLDVAAVDEKAGRVYFLASPDSAIERFLYRADLNGSGAIERVTPADQPGTHSYEISPDGRWAFHTTSRADVPPRVELISLPDHRRIRVLADNAETVSRVAGLVSSPTEFLTVDIGGGVVMDGSVVKPRQFDPGRKYPVIVYVYGEPAGQTVLDRWGGNNGLFHRALADEGYVIASFDNRGTPAPKGAAWRKVIYGTVGELSAREQTAAIEALAAKFSYVDRDRIGVWGWSGGGSSTLNLMFRSPDVYKVGVSVAPVPDQRLYDTIYQERYMGLPQDNAAGYRVGSPINFAEGLKGRLLIVHGSGDDNVHYQGTERLVNRLVELGKPFELMVYPNRTHAISEGPGTSLHVYSLIARYFLEHLPPGPR
jgi:dipeptidyl-peptidase-4